MQIHNFDGDILLTFHPISPHTKVCFLDRDGVIIEDVDHLHRLDQIRILEHSIDAIKILNKNKVPAIIISNQAVVAKGYCTKDELLAIFKEVHSRLLTQGARIEAIFFCPHHPEGTVQQYIRDCPWRKPHPGMLLKAKELFSIDLKRSIFIGDTTGDFLAATSADVTPVQVNTGYKGQDGKYDGKADFTYDNLLEAINDQIKNLI